MIENKKLFSFDEVQSSKTKISNPGSDIGEMYDGASDLVDNDESVENASTFPSILIPQTIITLLCLILILLISANKNNSWAKWIRHEIHYAVNASSENTFGYISRLSAYKSLMHNIENMIKLEDITQKISSNKLIMSNNREFQISSWPVQGEIIKHFGWKENPQSHTYEFNPGVLFESSPGDVVSAVGDGEVMHLTNQPGAGSVLIIGHGTGWSSIYHNLGKVKVNIGQAVRGGEPIAQVAGKELFLEVKYNEGPIDPWTLIKSQINDATI